MKVLAALGLAAIATGHVSLSAGAQTFSTQTVLTGLFSPRGLAFDSSGALYVTEAGVGGKGATIVDGGNASVSYGESGGVTRWQNGVQTRLINNLPSLADRTNGAPGGGATGLHDIVFVNGNAYGLMGFGADPAKRDFLTNNGAANASQFDSLVQLNLSGGASASVVTNLGAYESTVNPDGGELNSNPFGFTTLKNGGFAVADAGANAVLFLNSAGVVTSHVALPFYTNPIFDPTNPVTGGPMYQPVATSVVEGPDGTIYATELGGYPFIPGGAHINVIQNGVIVNSFGGFTNLTDVTYSNGKLYALQLTTNGLASPTGPGPGELLEIDPLTGAFHVLYNNLAFPGGLAVGPDGSFYVTNGITFPGTGSVLRITEVPEPSSVAFFTAGVLSGAGLLVRRKRARSAN